ncbi:MAG: LCP family protein, partial [Oscillospiraceae bacterium]
KKQKRKFSKFDKILTTISILFIVVSVCALGYVGLMNWSPLSERDQQGNVASLDEDIKTDAALKKKVTNFLVTGIDYAEGTGRAKLTDVLMVVNFNMETGKINVLQIPRDTYIGTEYPTGKINAVYGSKNKGGVENVARVIYDRFRLPIDHYVTVTMDGFASIIDAIGGVEINVQEQFTLEGVTIRPGLQTLNGTQSEKFVRERHSRGGDIGRINGQREFMAALVKKFKTLSMGEITSMAPTIFQNVTTDMNVKTVLAFAQKALKLDPSSMAFHMAAGEGMMINGYSVWAIHKDVLAETLNTNFRPFSDPVPASELNLEEVRNTTNYYDNNDTTVDDLLGGSNSQKQNGQ